MLCCFSLWTPITYKKVAEGDRTGPQILYLNLVYENIFTLMYRNEVVITQLYVLKDSRCNSKVSENLKADWIPKVLQ